MPSPEFLFLMRNKGERTRVPKPFNDWTEDEVVVHVIREVPETSPEKNGARLSVAALPRGFEFVWLDGTVPSGVAAEPVSLWFRRAFEWHAKQKGTTVQEFHAVAENRLGWRGGFTTVDGDWEPVVPAGRWDGDPHPSVIHVLAAACLLAAGKEVPK